MDLEIFKFLIFDVFFWNVFSLCSKNNPAKSEIKNSIDKATTSFLRQITSYLSRKITKFLPKVLFSTILKIMHFSISTKFN